MNPPHTEEKKNNAAQGQYYLIEKIAQGGMAEIYRGLAYDIAGIQKNVCIKKILPHIAVSKEFIEMLINEAKTAVKLNHGNIAQIYDLGKAGDDYFIVMEYVEGQNLSKIFKKSLRIHQPIPLPIILTIVSEIASGLDHMQRKTDEGGESLHIVHRDISPQNIMISYSGTVKIIDFGIAKGAIRVEATESGVLKGKFAYMSPEQANGDPLDHRSDIFSLGVIFHELLTGKRLFKASDSKQTLKNVRRAKFIPPSHLVPTLPTEIDQMIEKALAKDRRYRYSFASEFQEEILKFLHSRYPDFRTSKMGEWIRSLFEEEIKLEQQLSKQPLPKLVLEKTHSSVSGKTEEELSEETKRIPEGINWSDYLLEEEKSEDRIDAPESKQNIEEEREESEISTPETTTRQWFYAPSFKKQVALLGGGLFFLSLLSLGIWWGWQKKERPKPIPQKITTSPLPVAAPQKSKIEIHSEPGGAKIYLNDQDTGFLTPSQLEALDPAQTYMVGLYLEGYQFAKTQAPLKPGETSKLQIHLTPDYASVKILSMPEGADVFLNGVLMGQTPIEQATLKPGEILNIEIKKEGYQPFQQELRTESGKTHTIQTHLTANTSPHLPKSN